MGLARYHEKRDFSRTPEPRGRVVRGRAKKLSFVIQKHAARRLHYDFRLELDGVLKSWAVPKGPSFDPAEKRLAVEVEDHPLDYGGFEGTIPKGEYGGGTVLLWDRGTWTPIGDPHQGLAKGRLEFELAGEKLSGAWHLVRMGGRAAREGRPNWLLIKSRDASADARGAEITAARPESVESGRVIDEIAAGVGGRRTWHSNRGEKGKSSKPATRARSAKAKRSAEPARPAKTTARSAKAPRSTTVPRSTKTASPARSSSRTKPPVQRSQRTTTRQRTRSMPTSLASIPGSRRAGMPTKLDPELATLVDHAPEGDEWLHEIKFDGYRVLIRVRGGKARWMTRRGQDWSARMRPLDQALLALPVRQAVFDGEVVVLRPDGTTSFQDLQNAFGGDPAELTLYLFDLLYVDGRDLRGTPLEERKRVLEDLCRALPRGSRVRYSEHVTGFGAGFHAEACRHALEGIVSKRRAAPYRGGRQTDWQKTKCQARQEFVVGGWTEPQGAREVLGALLVGVHEDGELRYAGKVGSGYDRDTLHDLRRRLKPLARPGPAFVDPPRGAKTRGVHWVRPELVVEVEFTGWTDDGSLRHPTYQGLREDKRPQDVVREKPAELGSVRARGAPKRRGAIAAREGRAKETGGARRSLRAPERDVEVAGVRLTHADRVLWPEAGITKLDLARYYERVAERMLPHVAGRPVSIVRCPEGRAQACFFQRHAGLGVPASVRTVEVDEQRGRKPYLMIDSLAGLIGLVQIGALELHPWGARADRIEKPDRIVFDLDPAPEVEWSAMLELAREIRARLAERGLESFPKTTGGKGLHVVVPLARRATWDEVKPFAERLAKDLEREAPDRVIAKASKAARRGRIFVDWLRNSRGASAIAPYSTRSRENAPVAMPVGWKELTARLRPDQFTVANVAARLAKPDPWASFLDAARPLPASARR